MATVNIYLTFEGNCEEVFGFYKSVFGGEYSYVGRFKDAPPIEDYPPMPVDLGEKIMHIGLPISKETLLMGCDNIEKASGQKTITGNNFSISVTAESKADADRIFRALSSGGIITIPIADMFWGDYFGSLTDKFGINWMVSFPSVQQ